MISRRIIRVKVMQTLYALDSFSQPVKPGEPNRLLQKQFDQTRQLLLYVIHFITEVARYAEIDAKNRASKHLPTAADLEVNTKIAGNELLWKILEDVSYAASIKDDLIDKFTDKELVRKTYLELVNTPEYQEYIAAQSREAKSEKAILEYIYSHLLIGKEAFINHIEEQFSNWDDDCEMVNQLILQYLNKPGSLNFHVLVSHDKMAFAKDLLKSVLDKKDITLDLIKPKLKNWDPERIATLDM
ncbi:MAG TPA: transcription antitermination factor NusB, partial [Flavihumibacter sp.]